LRKSEGDASHRSRPRARRPRSRGRAVSQGLRSLRKNDSEMRNGPAALTFLALFCSFGCSRTQTSSSCVSEANGLSAASRAQYLRNDLAGAARLQYQASAGLKDCLDQHPSERTNSAEQRLGEMWMIAGQVEGTAGNTRLARSSLLHARDVFLKLRRTGSLHGSLLDMVLDEAHKVDSELNKP
jgi:hypothetical protein